MKKYLFLLMSLLAGCSSAQEVTYPVLPEGLKDCKFYYIVDGLSALKVVRCPNSQTSTSYQAGKTNQTASVIEK